MDSAEIRYAKSGDVDIAYSVSGVGPIDRAGGSATRPRRQGRAYRAEAEYRIALREGSGVGNVTATGVAQERPIG